MLSNCWPLIIMVAGAALFIASVLLYGINRSKYYQLISLFKEKYTFPPPYSFHCLVGFFGAAPVIYFFLGLKRKKKILFVKKDSELYNFFDGKDEKLTNWMLPFYYLWNITMLCCAFVIIFGMVMHIKLKYFP